MANEPARNPPAPLTPDEELAWRALARAVLVIPKVLDGELLQAQGLGLTEYSVLMNLSEQPGRSMRMSELANDVSISVSGLTRVVERLSRQGLVERVKADTDGRGQLAVADRPLADDEGDAVGIAAGGGVDDRADVHRRLNTEVTTRRSEAACWSIDRAGPKRRTSRFPVRGSPVGSRSEGG